MRILNPQIVQDYFRLHLTKPGMQVAPALFTKAAGAHAASFGPLQPKELKCSPLVALLGKASGSAPLNVLQGRGSEICLWCLRLRSCKSLARVSCKSTVGFQEQSFQVSCPAAAPSVLAPESRPGDAGETPKMLRFHESRASAACGVFSSSHIKSALRMRVHTGSALQYGLFTGFSVRANERSLVHGCCSVSNEWLQEKAAGLWRPAALPAG